MRRSSTSLILGSAIALAGCGPTTPQGGGGGGGAPADAGALCPVRCDGPLPSAERDQNWPCSTDAPLCDAVRFSTPPDFSIHAPYTLETPAAAQCALDALRDGKQGYLRVSAYSKGGPGVSLALDFFVRPSRVVLTKRGSYRDLITQVSFDAGRLQESAYFSECLAKTGDALFECFDRAAGLSCQ